MLYKRKFRNFIRFDIRVLVRQTYDCSKCEWCVGGSGKMLCADIIIADCMNLMNCCGAYMIPYHIKYLTQEQINYALNYLPHKEYALTKYAIQKKTNI